MRVILYIFIYLLIFCETSVNANYPYYAIALSFTGYMAYKKQYKFIIFAVITAIITGISGEHLAIDIIFYSLYFLLMMNLYRFIYFEKINIIVISFVEAFIYILFIYMFKINEINFMVWVKEFGLLLVYNYLFAKLEKNMSRQVHR
jgi:hypothetical protein